MVWLVASGNPRRLGRHAVDRGFRADLLGRGRIRRHESSGPPLLKPSLKVKRNGAHGKAPRSWSPPVSRPQRARSIKGPLRSHHGNKSCSHAIGTVGCARPSRALPSQSGLSLPPCWGRFFSGCSAGEPCTGANEEPQRAPADGHNWHAMLVE